MNTILDTLGQACLMLFAVKGEAIPMREAA